MPIFNLEKNMIKEPETLDNLTMNVMLKNGVIFTGMNITGKPFGDHERIVSFWHGDVIRMYPMSEVAYVELVPGA